VRTIRSHIRPVQALEMPPVVINIVKQFTGEEPMSGIVADAEAVIQQPGMLSASVAEGYPYADVAEMGMAFLAISDSDAIAAREAARWRARRAWDKRAQFIATTPSADAALEAVMAAPRGSDGTFEEPTPIHGGFRFFRWRADRRPRDNRRSHPGADHTAHRQHQHPADVLRRRGGPRASTSWSPRGSSRRDRRMRRSPPRWCWSIRPA